MKEYAAYKGDKLVCIGTSWEIADRVKIKRQTVAYYLTPSYRNRVAKRKNVRNAIAIFRLDDD